MIIFLLRFRYSMKDKSLYFTQYYSHSACNPTFVIFNLTYFSFHFLDEFHRLSILEFVGRLCVSQIFLVGSGVGQHETFDRDHPGRSAPVLLFWLVCLFLLMVISFIRLLLIPRVQNHLIIETKSLVTPKSVKIHVSNRLRTCSQT